MYPVYVCIFLVAATGTDFGGGFGFGGPPANSSSSGMNFGFGFGGDSTPTAPQQNNQGPIMLNLKQLSLVVVLLTRVILVPWCFLLRLYTCFWWQYNFRLPKHVLLLLRGWAPLHTRRVIAITQVHLNVPQSQKSHDSNTMYIISSQYRSNLCNR